MNQTNFGSKLKHDNPLEELSLYFLEKNLNVGDAITLRLIEKTNMAVFLPHEVVRSFPLSSARLDDILHQFHVKVGSPEAYEVEQTLKKCEKKFFENETRQCVMSLESMVDFATTWVGKDVRAISTSIDSKRTHSKRKKYIIKENIVRLQANVLAACHKLYYPYALYKCHAFSQSSRAYALMVPLKGSDGEEVEALAVCHNYYNLYWPTRELNQIIMEMLKARRGVDPICHFLSKDAVVWKPTGWNS